MLRIFGNTAGLNLVGSISFICTVIQLTRVTCIYIPQIHMFSTCSKDVALVAEVGELRISCSWNPGFDSNGMLYNIITIVYLINFLAFWEYDCFQKSAEGALLLRMIWGSVRSHEKGASKLNSALQFHERQEHAIVSRTHNLQPTVRMASSFT